MQWADNSDVYIFSEEGPCLWQIRYFNSIFSSHSISRAVERSPKCIRKSSARWIQKNLRNINLVQLLWNIQNWQVSFHLVFFMIPVSCPEWSRSCFAARYKIFSNITHQPVLTEVWPNMARIFLEYALEHLLTQERYLCPALTFNFIQQKTRERNAKLSWVALQIIFCLGCSIPESEHKIWV